MNETEKRIRGSASEAFRRLNPKLFGAAMGAVRRDKQELQQDEGKALERDEKARGRTKGRRGNRVSKPEHLPSVRVTIIAHTLRQIDYDNLGPATKALRDYIASYLGLDDSEREIDWQYGNVTTRGERGITVKLETI